MSLLTKALVLREKNAIPTVEDFFLPPMRNNQVTVKIHAAALNHRDVWIQQGLYAKIQYPTIVGSDGCGYVSDVAEGVSESLIGQRVIIHPSLMWGDDIKAQSNNFQVLGMPTYGTFAHHCIVDADRVYAAPSYLSDAECAALPLAGLTAWRALMTQGKAQSHHKVLITGIGGGVALCAAQFALALGAEVWVTSGSQDKITMAQHLGAKGGILYSEPDFGKSLMKSMGGFDIIVDGTGGETFNHALEAIKPGGTIVIYGATAGTPNNVNIHRIFWKQVHIIGSTMGNDNDFAEMLAFVSQHRIKPIIAKTFLLEQGAEAFRYLQSGAQTGKVVLLMENM